ncbi:MAG: hypothetical protein HQL80_06555 [Magnetococcales bacterium]|nr:hypothetical protein [Magnetococcales bacterium]
MKKQPEVNLWIAVLSRAIQDLDVPEESSKALAWIKSSDENPGSFNFVADVLNQEPKVLRHSIMRWYRQRLRLQQAA